MKFQPSIGMFLPLLLGMIFFTQSSMSGEPDWYPYVVARRTDRVVIQNTPMHQRPYRPMHFYGNAVRRAYHRGTPAPLPRDIIRSATVVWRR